MRFFSTTTQENELCRPKSGINLYPGGSIMPGRNYNSSGYRYGFNQGSEKDDEITGVTGAHITTFFREFDLRLNRTWSIDPMAHVMPWQSPYSSMDNSPIWVNDPMGDCPTCPDETYVPIAEHVYEGKLGDVTENGWEIVRVDENSKSGYKGALYQGTFEGKTEYIYATAGTDDKEDASEDVEQIFGGAEQYKISVGIAEHSEKNYPGTSYTGHSLGGGLASANALKVEGKAVTFNAAGISNATRKGLGLTGKSANITAYVVNGEAVSYYQAKIGIVTEGVIKVLPATYIPNIPFTSLDDLYRTYQRGVNHTMGVVIEKFNEQQKKEKK